MSDQMLLTHLLGLVREIPAGKVTTFWHLARALGIAGNRSALRVGQLVAKLQGQDVPYQRIVLKLHHRGMVPLKSARSGRASMVDIIALLKCEGVPFDGDYIRLKECLWTPNRSVANFDPPSIPLRKTDDQLDAAEKIRKVV
jgi:alkylated DNA nucleotide flippase Atl1